MTNSNNPLTKLSTLKNRALPFAEIKNQHFLPALDWAIEQAQTNLQKIKQAEEPNFTNTIEALETAGEDVSQVASTFYNMLSAHTNDELQDIASSFGPKLSEYTNDILLDTEIFANVKSVYEQKSQLNLKPEQLRLLEETYENFTRNGALLNNEQKEQLRKIDQKLAQLSPQFSNNVLKATNAFELLLTTEDELKGLPKSFINSAKEEAAAKGKDGYLITLQYPSLIPFMKFSANRELREKVWRAANTRSTSGEYSNQQIVLETVQLRQQRAQLLGFNTHADFVLQKRMAEKPEKVLGFIDELLNVSLPAAKKEVAELKEFAQKLDDIDELMPWDFNYYSEKMKEQKYSLKEEELKPYFQLEKCIDGVFAVAGKLFQIEFRESQDYPKYHQDVRVYEVFDKNSQDFVGVFYADFFPRESKKSGAWMTTFYEQGLFKGLVMRPHVSIVCNFTKPTSSQPALLNFNEVRTLFHEFGHALHGLLSQCHYRSLGGTNVYWDFVELPSQVFENWTLEKECLDMFAKHYESGESIPEAMIEKLKASEQFMAGYNSLRQLSFATLDMKWHGQDNTKVSDPLEFENQATSHLQILPKIEGTNVSCAFSHIFAGGYSAGYYSYKWAEVLDADAFEYFKEKGVFDEGVAASFKTNILERGGTEHPMQLYKKFRGREPDSKALLKRDGLL